MEHRIKTIDELTLMDDYMFAQVMRDTRHLKPLLQFVLQVPIAKIELIEPQKTEKEGYDSKGIRLDLYVTDEQGVVYNVEVQTTSKKHLPKRMRYYQSTIDISILRPGVDYKELRKTFVIFICNYDPFGRNRYVYTFENICREEPDLLFGDETVKVIVNTRGEIGEISEELKEVIRYLNDGTISGQYSQELDTAVTAVKSNEERRLEYMTLAMHDMEIREEALEEGRQEGREEGFTKGKDEERLFNIRNAMKKLNLSVEKAMDFMDIPAEDQPKYALMLKETDPQKYQP